MQLQEGVCGNQRDIYQGGALIRKYSFWPVFILVLGLTASALAGNNEIAFASAEMTGQEHLASGLAGPQQFNSTAVETVQPGYKFTRTSVVSFNPPANGILRPQSHSRWWVVVAANVNVRFFERRQGNESFAESGGNTLIQGIHRIGTDKGLTFRASVLCLPPNYLWGSPPGLVPRL